MIYDHIIKRNGKFYAAGEEVPDLISGASKEIQGEQKTEKESSKSKSSRRKQE